MGGVDVCASQISQVMAMNSGRLGSQFPTRLSQFSNSSQHRLDDMNHGWGSVEKGIGRPLLKYY